MESEPPRRFETGNLLLRHVLNGGGQRLHNLPVARTQLLVVGLDFLYQHVRRAVGKGELLHIHLVENQPFHRLYAFPLLGVDSRNKDSLQGLAHFDACFAA